LLYQIIFVILQRETIKTITIMGLTNIEMETLSAVKSAARKYANQEIDWEQRRYEIAKDILPTLLLPSGRKDAVKQSVEVADLLIRELKKQ